jgi:hypothetical protein
MRTSGGMAYTPVSKAGLSRFESELVYLSRAGGGMAYALVSGTRFCGFDPHPAYKYGGMAELVMRPAATRYTLRRAGVRVPLPPLWRVALVGRQPVLKTGPG